MKYKLPLKLACQTMMVLALVAFVLPLRAQESTAMRVAEFKATMAASKAVLRQYEWIETTVVSLKGEEKSRKQERCYYGDDGKEQKIELTPPAPEEKERGLRGLIKEKKKEELEDYMKEAVRLVRQYFPPDPVRIQAVKDSGNVSIQILEPGKRVRLTFSGYLKIGDRLSVDVDLANNHPVAANLKTYLDSDSDKNPVTVAVNFSTLDGGATYVSDAVLDAPAKKLAINIENSGYLKKSAGMNQ